MSRRNTRLLKTALSAIHYSGAGRLLSPLTRGAGVIFTMHHVTPEAPREFEPNRILKITPQFLEAVICRVREAGFDVVSLDEAADRLEGGAGGRPFACFTLDDGYRDNRDHAYPVFKRHDVPFTVYIPSAFADGHGDLWWLTLEQIIAGASVVEIDLGSGPRQLGTSTAAEKHAAFHSIYWHLRRMPEMEARALVADLAFRHGVSTRRLPDELLMRWNEVRDFARDPLVTIGAHTCRHLALAKLTLEEAEAEMRESITRIEDELDRPCRHFSYPYGDEASAGEREFELGRSLGCRTGVTTRKGLIHAGMAQALTALPRLSLNGDYQDLRYLDVILSGVPFALRDVARRMVPSRVAA